MIILKATFDITTIALVISGVGGQQIHIVGIDIENNSGDDLDVRLILNSPGEDQYGSGANALYLRERARWGLYMTRDSIACPYFVSTDAGTDFYLFPVTLGEATPRISGAVWYYQE